MRIPSVNVTKFAVPADLVTFTEETLNWKTSTFVQWKLANPYYKTIIIVVYENTEILSSWRKLNALVSCSKKSKRILIGSGSRKILIQPSTDVRDKHCRD